MLKLYKEGANMAIWTDIERGDDFIDAVAAAFDHLVEGKYFDGDWQFQFQYWLPLVREIANECDWDNKPVHWRHSRRLDYRPSMEEEVVIRYDDKKYRVIEPFNPKVVR